MDASGDLTATLMSINGQPVPANRTTIFQEGTYRLVYTAEDSSGNSATCDVYLDVLGKIFVKKYSVRWADKLFIFCEWSFKQFWTKNNSTNFQYQQQFKKY